MAYVIAEPCIGTKDTSCVDVCPTDCIHPRKDETEFAAVPQLYIDPAACIDCGACLPACPVGAILGRRNFLKNGRSSRGSMRTGMCRNFKHSDPRVAPVPGL